jgi:ATPase family associated with various cellular activities (AAA)
LIGNPASMRLLSIDASGELVFAVDGDAIAAVGVDGETVWRHEVPGLTDAAVVGEQLWAVADPGTQVERFDLRGNPLAPIVSPFPLGQGRWMTSPLASSAGWIGARSCALRSDGAVVVPEVDTIAPTIDGRWLLWRNGTAAMWRSVGEAWRRSFDDPGASLLQVSTLTDGRMIALCFRRRGNEDLRMAVLGSRDGDILSSMRLSAVNRLCIAARRAVALVQVGDKLELIDLRFGRALRQIYVDPEIDQLVVDDTLQYVATTRLGSPRAVRLRGLAEFEREAAEAAEQRAEQPDDEGLSAPAAEAPRSRRLSTRSDRDADPGERPRRRFATQPDEDAQEAASVDDEVFDADALEMALPHSSSRKIDLEVLEPTDPPISSEQEEFDDHSAIPDGVLLGLRPTPQWPQASAAECKALLDARLDLLGARVSAVIADAWDIGRIVHNNPARPPFAAEVAGILRQASGLAPDLVAAARQRCTELEQSIVAIDQKRSGLIPLESLGRQFGLTPLAGAILMLAAAPHLRGDYARLYGILGNDPNRALCDEQLVVQILGQANAEAVARELDRDRPLRRFGLITLAETMPRPFGGLTVEPLVVRIIRALPLDADPDPYLKPRHADRPLEELWTSSPSLRAAVRALLTERPDPVRLVIRGRVGSGRHSVLAAMAARARRTLGVIDLSAAPKDPLRASELLRVSLRRAAVRGWIPCIDGIEQLVGEDLDVRNQVSALLRDHPDPLAVRLLPGAQAPLVPGYLTIDLPVLDERSRERVWLEVVERRGLPMPEVSELAARYRVGPGVIERVCTELGKGELPSDGASATAAIDSAVRQHLENRIGSVASRVSRLATWADVILPDDILDSLVEMTGRVRHRKTVFEKWGYSRSMSTSRGITALFSGGPGTGKTMVAGVLARDLGVELYRVDVSRITSKWIGETEKNLGSLFDAAEDGQVMLLFDEADSLFAKRTEVRTSVDRYANMEVNYLLQRLDSFEGLAILTSNFGTAIDPAFKRRLSFRVTFPFPDEEMREQLWRSLIPPGVPCAEGIDFAGLGQRYKLSGGYIRNSSLRAAFLAAEEGVPLSQEHIERAIRAEFREIGKLASTGTLD